MNTDQNAAAPAPKAAQRPNVVLIFMDDFTWWAIGSLGCQPIATPNLDRLAQSGTLYRQAFNQGGWTPAVCVPARAMMLSGRTLFHARHTMAESPVDPSVTTIGAAFRRGGYRSYFAGKWHNPEELLATSYDESDEACLAGMLPPNKLDRPWDPSDPAFGGHWMTDTSGRVVHSSERWTDAALRQLADHRREHADQPFFLHVAYHAPHDPRQAPKRWRDRYPDSAIPVPPNFLPEHPFDQGDHDIRDEELAPFPRTPERIQAERADYFAIVSHADEQIGRILDALDDAQLTDNTIICFSGDHGLALGEHGLLGKQSLYDHSVRVPLILAGPGVPAGVINNSLVYQSSLHPTLLGLAGLPANPTIEFSTLPLGSDPGTEDHIFLAYRDFQRGIRTPQWSLTCYRPAGVVQLFDMTADPWQLNNLADDPGHADIRRELESALRRAQDRLDDDSGDWVADLCSRPS